MAAAADILIFTGEYSGNVYGALVARSLLEERPALRLAGTGCAEMADAGVEILADCSTWGGIGPIEVLKRLDLYRWYFHLWRIFRHKPPRLVILIDYPFFNMRVARVARRYGIPTLYYIPPGKFARKPEDIRDAASTCTRIAAPFRFTYENYCAANAPVEFVGHPLFDLLPANPDRKAFRERVGVSDGARLVALLAGSRMHEIRAHAPTLCRCARALASEYPGTRFVCPLPDIRDRTTSRELRKTVDRWIAHYGQPIDVVQGGAHEAMAASDLLIIASGTATLEAAYYRTPMVIVYKTSWLTEFLAGFVYSRFPRFFALPNMIAERLIVPEFIQERFIDENLLGAARRLLNDDAYADTMRADLGEVVEALGTPGASRRVARMAFELMDRYA